MDTSFGSAFADVDESSDPNELSQYLGRVRTVPAVMAAKRESFALLDVGPRARVLDIGCGAGDDVRELAGLVGPAGGAVGVDKSEVLIAEARRAAEPVRGRTEFFCADVMALPFPDGSFDRCRADRTIQHVPQADLGLREILRVTGSGGVLVLSEMLNVLDLGGDEPDAATRSVLGRLWTDKERQGWIGLFLPLMLRQAGFEDVELHRHTVHLTSFEDAALLLNLPRLCMAAQRAGNLTPGNAADWLARLEQDFTSGRAGLESTFVHLKAYKHMAGRNKGAAPSR